MGDHVFFLLFFISFFNGVLNYIFFVFYETPQKQMENGEIKEELDGALFKHIFWSKKRGLFTPFFFVGTLSSINYILTSAANPHVRSIYQVLASLLQLPFVMIFNWIFNGESIFNPQANKMYQILLISGTFIFYFSGLLLISQKEFQSKFENLGWFICYLLSTLPLPLMSVLFQFLLSRAWKQEDMVVYSKRSLLLAMLNFWQLFFLTLTIWLIPFVDSTSISYSFSTGLDCVFNGKSEDPKDVCDNTLLVLLCLTLCVIFNFYASLKVITFEDANFAILVQQVGPIISAAFFSSEAAMGRYYDGKTNGWETYISIVLISLAFLCYKLNKSLIKSQANQSPKNPKKTLFYRMWVIEDTGYGPINDEEL